MSFRGGIRLTVNGSYLNSVARSILTITMSFLDDGQLEEIMYQQVSQS